LEFIVVQVFKSSGVLGSDWASQVEAEFGRIASAEIQPCPASHADDTEANDPVEQSTQKNPLYQVNHCMTNRPSQTINSGSGQTLLLNRRTSNNTDWMKGKLGTLNTSYTGAVLSRSKFPR
jgi:hypothetical protein